MRSRHRPLVLFLGGFSLLSVATACSIGRARILLPDGSYEVKCEGPLAGCLLQMEQVCSDNGYDVLRATEKRERNGPPELQTNVVRSQGIVRCRKANAIFSSPSPTPELAPAPTEAPPPLPHHPPLPPLHAPPSSAAPASAPAPVTTATPPVAPSASPSSEPASPPAAP
jgi:hypothetical protein